MFVSNKASENEEVLNKYIEMLTSAELQIRLHKCFQLETYYRDNFQAVSSIFEIQDLAIGCIVWFGLYTVSCKEICLLLGAVFGMTWCSPAGGVCCAGYLFCVKLLSYCSEEM